MTKLKQTVTACAGVALAAAAQAAVPPTSAPSKAEAPSRDVLVTPASATGPEQMLLARTEKKQKLIAAPPVVADPEPVLAKTGETRQKRLAGPASTFAAADLQELLQPRLEKNRKRG